MSLWSCYVYDAAYVIALLLCSGIITASLFRLKTLYVSQHIEDDASSKSFHVILQLSRRSSAQRHVKMKMTTALDLDLGKSDPAEVPLRLFCTC
jgi:hypothetical protein